MTSHTPIPAVLIGTGPLGINSYRYALKRHDIIISQVVDIDLSLKGKDMGEHAGFDTTELLIMDR